eukprot:CAMPEP_0170502718 /NCGR_PEP_ID=MMETSP0208-20121228/42373_1 /TAXON_ID=197538 /ORGANISM="Strombidium inclinatum, Strain S3" /LENGTH=103 /DNA_ID=CAMNT_0010781965 /DNA_START=437 /DNA_END=748 /DNA_ORIENTATION=-
MTYWESWTIRHFTADDTKEQIRRSLRFSKKLKKKEERVRDRILRQADTADISLPINLKANSHKNTRIASDSDNSLTTPAKNPHHRLKTLSEVASPEVSPKKSE